MGGTGSLMTDLKNGIGNTNGVHWPIIVDVLGLGAAIVSAWPDVERDQVVTDSSACWLGVDCWMKSNKYHSNGFEHKRKCLLRFFQWVFLQARISNSDPFKFPANYVSFHVFYIILFIFIRGLSIFKWEDIKYLIILLPIYTKLERDVTWIDGQKVK